ncbi:MAG TPA: mannose-1-phosphate guanylyltransferase [Jatrophihabitantaceae bacterium]
MHDDVYAVIPAGGSGTRLWPLSRTGRPKFLHPLTGTDRSLLQATFDRLAPLVGPNHVYVVTGMAHADAVAAQLPELAAANLVVEPSPRDSCAAIALATGIIERRAPGAVIGSFAADHLINDVPAFHAVVRAAVEGARAGRLMTIGITPTRPETGYGYLECGEPLGAAWQRVLAFREKPTLDVATEYVKSGRYLWNAGMFVWSAAGFLDQLGRRRPDVAEPVQRIAAAWDGPDHEAVLAATWPTLPKVAVEYAVMEPASLDGLVATVPGDFGWSDIGDFETVGTLLGRDEDGITVVGDGPVVNLDSDGVIVVPSDGRLVAVLDVHDVVVVDTPDAVVVCRRDRVQDVKKLTERLRERGDDEYV